MFCRFADMVDGLTSEVAGDAEVEWFIEDLQTGSAIRIGNAQVIDTDKGRLPLGFLHGRKFPV